MPHVGRKRDELALGLRSVTQGNYVILYLSTASGVFIVRVSSISESSVITCEFFTVAVPVGFQFLCEDNFVR